MIIGELTETYPPTLDGVGRVTLAYCRALEEAGHTVYYIAPDDANHTRVDGLNTLIYSSYGIPGQNYRLGLGAFRSKFKCDVRDIPFDIIHIHSPFLSASIAKTIIAKRKDVPVVATFHSKYYDDFLKATHSKLIARKVVDHIVKVYNQCDSVWTVNRETANVLTQYGYSGPIHIAQNGTDIHEISPAGIKEIGQKLDVPDGRPLLLFVGQIDMKKNIHSVIRACHILKRDGFDFTLALAGKGPDREKLEKLRNELDLRDRVKFLGFIGQGDELRSLYARSNLFVFPSVYDNAPMVVREAAACGTPSILVRGSCSAEGVTDGVNGFLCENTPEDIAECIKRALPQSREVGEKAKATIPQPWHAIIKDVVTEYEALINKKKAGI